MVSVEENDCLWTFFFARSCLDKVPGRAPFSQLSKPATACTIRMQIVKQINENESDIRKLINQLGSKCQSELTRRDAVRPRVLTVGRCKGRQEPTVQTSPRCYWVYTGEVLELVRNFRDVLRS